MKRYFFFILIFLVLALGFLLIFTPRFNFHLKENAPVVRIGEKLWLVEYAQTREERERGLGYRSTLEAGHGMLFIFDTPGKPTFWMKGMEFPLDIVFIDKNRVVSIEKGIAPDDTRLFTPPLPAQLVLEMNAGEGEGIEPGMKVSLPALP